VLVGPIQTKKAIKRGRDPVEARKDAEVRIASVIARSVAMAGRETLQKAAEQDPKAEGFVRVASPSACEYCRSFVGRVLTDKTGGGFHNHCSCEIEPVFVR
jgi:hypothetical protein